jgi:hypothetical protein
MLVIRNNATRARHIIVVFAILIGVKFLSFLSLSWQYTLLTEFQQHPDAPIDYATLQMSDNIRIGMIIMSLAVYILAIIFFISWFRRAYYNLHAIPGSSPAYAEGWAAGWWFVPVMNLFRPYQIMREIWDGTQKVITHRLDKLYSLNIIVIWWTAFIVMNVYGNITARISNSANNVDELLIATRLEMIGDVLTIISAFIAIIMVKRAQVLQQKLYEEALEPGESVFSLMAE